MQSSYRWCRLKIKRNVGTIAAKMPFKFITTTSYGCNGGHFVHVGPMSQRRWTGAVNSSKVTPVHNNNNFQHENTRLFILENAPENIVCEMEAILSKGRWVNGVCRQGTPLFNRDWKKQHAIYGTDTVKWDVIRHLCFNLSGGLVKPALNLREWMTNHIPHKTIDVLTYPCPNLS